MVGGSSFQIQSSATLRRLAPWRAFLFYSRQAAIRLRRTQRFPSLMEAMNAWKTQMTTMTTDVHGSHDLCSFFMICDDLCCKTPHGISFVLDQLNTEKLNTENSTLKTAAASGCSLQSYAVQFAARLIRSFFKRMYFPVMLCCRWSSQWQSRLTFTHD
jgi:hypothetical protein